MAEANAIKLEEEVKSLKEELDVYKEAKTMSEACTSLSQFAQSTEEPFTSSHPEPNEWHKSAGGGAFRAAPSCLAIASTIDPKYLTLLPYSFLVYAGGGCNIL